MSRRSPAARTGAQTATGGVVVAGTNQYRLLLRLAGRRLALPALDGARIHQDLRDTPWGIQFAAVAIRPLSRGVEREAAC